jgi:PAS domain S-box-containing protein
MSDLEGLTFVGTNGAASQLLGYVPGSLEGMSILDIVSEVDRTAVKRTARLLHSGAIEDYRSVRRLKRANGAEFKATVWVRLKHVGEGRFGLGIVVPEQRSLPQLQFGTHVSAADRLTDAELRVALLVAEGLSNREVGEYLCISRYTVDSHLRSIFRKLSIGSRVELTRVVMSLDVRRALWPPE